MNVLGTLSRLAGAIIVLGVSASTLANTIAPFVFQGIPSYWAVRLGDIFPLSLLASLPASVLTAFLERPFLTAGGLRTRTLWYSLQANFVSMLFGFLLVPLAVLGPLAIPLAIFITICVERKYYQVRCPNGAAISTGWVAWANIFSSVVLLLLEPLAQGVRDAWPRLFKILRPCQPTLLWIGAIGAAVIFILSFVMAWRRGLLAMEPAAVGSQVRQAAADAKAE